MFQSSKLSYAIVLSLFSHYVSAQDSQSALADSDTSLAVNDIEVIEVYAQKRAQNIRDVSIAVSVVSGDAIDRFQLKDTTQLAGLVPNVKITNNAGEGTPPAFNIRGIGMMDYNTSTISPIAIYNDDVVGGSANNLSVNLFDVDHVEVLRGPQGTLFGRNTTGGAILIRSKQPEPEFGGYINGSIAEHDHRSLDSAINIPLSDQTAVRFALNHEDYQFSTNNLMPDQPDGGLKQTNVRAILKTELENLTITAKVHQEDWRGKPKPIASLGINRLDGNGLCTPSQAGSALCMTNFGHQVGGDDFWDVYADTSDRRHESNSWGADLKLEWQLSKDISINSITGYKDLERFHSWDSDGPGNFIEGSMGTDNRLFSQEFNLLINYDHGFWVTGLFFVDEEITQHNDIDIFRDFRAIPALAAIPAQFIYNNQLDNRSVALYTQVDYALQDNWTLTAGLRYTKEQTDYHAIADLDIVPMYIANFWDIDGTVADGEFSGKLALNHQLNDTTSIYYSFSRGYKSGGYNAGYTTSAEQAADSEYAPETVNAYEVGTKLIFWQQNASLNMAAFYYDYQDQQVFVNMTTGPAPYHVLKNAGDSTIYGVEAELMVTPTDNLQFRLNVGYLPEAKMGTYRQGQTVVEDNRLPFASKWNVSGFMLYEMTIMGRALISQLGFDYQSAFYFDQNANPYTEQTGFTVFNGRASYEVNEQFVLSLWGKNLTNTEHSELRFDSIAALGAITELKAEGRQLGVELAYTF